MGTGSLERLVDSARWGVSLQCEKTADIADILSDIGELVVWEGKTYSAIITSVDQIDTLQIGGFAEEYDFTVKIPKAALGLARPKVKDPIQFDDKTWRISKVSESPSYPMVTLMVQSR